VELVLACFELVVEDELECVLAEPLLGDELPLVAANATPLPPTNARVVAAAARVVRLNTVPPFIGLRRRSNQRLLGTP
jgi:hypothetical protein